jgi:hypothetical protein
VQAREPTMQEAGLTGTCNHRFNVILLVIVTVLCSSVEQAGG